MATAPAITTQPQSQSVTRGSAVSFSVAATGSNLSYQWYRNDQPMSGQTGTSVTIASAASVDSGDIYTVKVTNPVGETISSKAILTVTTPAPSLLGTTAYVTLDVPSYGKTVTRTVDATTASPAIDFPFASSWNNSSGLIGVDIDVDTNKINLQYLVGANAPNDTSVSNYFNGYVIKFNDTSPVITGVSLNRDTNFSDEQRQHIVLTFTAHEVAINVAGLQTKQGDRIIIDVQLAATTP